MASTLDFVRFRVVCICVTLAVTLPAAVITRDLGWIVATVVGVVMLVYVLIRGGVIRRS